MSMPASVILMGQEFPVELVDSQHESLHEVLHVLCRMINLIPKEAEEERVVVALAPLLLDAIRRNPAMVKYLVAA